MVIMFAAPPAAASTSLPLLRHCMALLRSDMLLLRQVGGSGLWLLMTQMASSGAAGNEPLLAELKQVSFHCTVIRFCPAPKLQMLVTLTDTGTRPGWCWGLCMQCADC
jgi:hypothetical protein